MHFFLFIIALVTQIDKIFLPSTLNLIFFVKWAETPWFSFSKDECTYKDVFESRRCIQPIFIKLIHLLYHLWQNNRSELWLNVKAEQLWKKNFKIFFESQSQNSFDFTKILNPAKSGILFRNGREIQSHSNWM